MDRVYGSRQTLCHNQNRESGTPERFGAGEIGKIVKEWDDAGGWPHCFDFETIDFLRAISKNGEGEEWPTEDPTEEGWYKIDLEGEPGGAIWYFHPSAGWYRPSGCPDELKVLRHSPHPIDTTPPERG